MKLGLQINNFSWAGGPARSSVTLADIARTAEECGFDRIGVADHLWQHPIMGGPKAEELECYTTLAFLAANTERVNLTAMVTGVHFRHPGVLAKTVTPLNVPQSLSRPHPPIMIAGDGEKKTLRLVARYADACSLRPGPEIPRKLDV